MCNRLHAQLQNVDPDETEEQNLESLSESTETESEDEYYLQQMVFYKGHPLNINGSIADLDEFPLLEPLQIANLVKYRELLGDLISVYELQSVPGFPVELIKRMLPYITIAGNEASAGNIQKRFTGGDRTLVFRPSAVPEKSVGFSRNTPPAQKYQGGREKMLARYKYQYRDLLQYGMVADQDAGEKFVFNHVQAGFDFCSIHLFMRKIGVLKSLALGDYTVNLGQGLVQWQSQAYNKSAGVIDIKRQSETLRPYHSAGEYNFMRGVGITLKKWNFESTVFASHRKLSANTDYDEHGKIITSVQTSGLHRTLSEIEDRNVVAMTIAGGNLKWQKGTAHIGINAVQYHYSLPLHKRNQPYNLYSIKGKYWANYSTDYSLTFRNYHFFGEFATDKDRHQAVVGGLMASLSPAVDIALLFRSISAAYQSIYGNAFTENTMPTNENGLYMGVSIKPAAQWKIGLYTDLFRFPWLRYRADAPGFGSQFLAQITWQPNKKVEVYSRFRFKLKPINELLPQETASYPQDKVLRNWRTNISFHLTRDLLLRNRIEFCWYGYPGDTDPETGFLLYMDALYKPFGKSWSVSARFQAFETGGYDTRLYAYENDVLFSNSTPAFFDKGSRIYVNLKSRLSVKVIPGYQVNLGLKASASLYSGTPSIGSGQDQITGDHKSEIKIQIILAAG
jgi:hypothetical protein